MAAERQWVVLKSTTKRSNDWLYPFPPRPNSEPERVYAAWFSSWRTQNQIAKELNSDPAPQRFRKKYGCYLDARPTPEKYGVQRRDRWTKGAIVEYKLKQPGVFMRRANLLPLFEHLARQGISLSSREQAAVAAAFDDEDARTEVMRTTNINESPMQLLLTAFEAARWDAYNYIGTNLQRKLDGINEPLDPGHFHTENERWSFKQLLQRTRAELSKLPLPKKPMKTPITYTIRNETGKIKTVRAKEPWLRWLWLGIDVYRLVQLQHKTSGR